MKTTRLPIALALVSVTAFANAADFKVEWSNVGPQPLSPMFWSVGSSSFDLFSIGGTASAGIKAIAESGDTAPMLAIAAGAGSSLQQYGVLGPGPLMPGNTRSAMISVNSGDDYFSFASMLGMTNDGFVGEGVSSMGLRLFSGSVPTGFSVTILGNRAWDAGTELNTQDAADLAALGGSGNPSEMPGYTTIRIHESIISGRGDSFSQLPDWDSSTELMTLTVTPVPEPGTMAAIGLGLFGLLRRKKTSA